MESRNNHSEKQNHPASLFHLPFTLTSVWWTALTYYGQRMKIVGKLSITVQSVINGAVSDKVHVSVDVVQDLPLLYNLDVDRIAGEKLIANLQLPTALPPP